MPARDLEAMLVSEFMRRWPETVPVFLRRRMSCPGCLLAPFMTLAEAAAAYGVAPADLARDCRAAIEAGKENEVHP